MKSAVASTKILIRIDPQLKQAAAKAAQREDRSLSSWIKRAITAALARKVT